MKIEELRDLSREELQEHLKSARGKLFSLKIGAAQGREANSSNIKEAKITISRIKTVLRKRELEKGGKFEQ
ncbi:50S ribosomal protein L29 [Candidatus Aerophobetes bacterium]|uniref:Large ribosomal subunit protein uL29 n=1 Tax=Aerophobetes bacterium TaxID=2030807 RepID=A0A523ZID4_UNCAE|nr:MAG: 50S ribosomal protein L29 [Candidatus Aerophobetes bacterium]